MSPDKIKVPDCAPVFNDSITSELPSSSVLIVPPTVTIPDAKLNIASFSSLPSSSPFIFKFPDINMLEMVDVKVVVLSFDRFVTVPPIVSDEQDNVPPPEIVAA